MIKFTLNKTAGLAIWTGGIPASADIIGTVSQGRGHNKKALAIFPGSCFVQINQSGLQEDLDSRDAFPAFIKAYIKADGISQEDFSIDYGFPLATVQSWACGRRLPSTGLIRLLYKFWIINH